MPAKPWFRPPPVGLALSGFTCNTLPSGAPRQPGVPACDASLPGASAFRKPLRSPRASTRLARIKSAVKYNFFFVFYVLLLNYCIVIFRVQPCTVSNLVNIIPNEKQTDGFVKTMSNLWSLRATQGRHRPGRGRIAVVVLTRPGGLGEWLVLLRRGGCAADQARRTR